MLYVTGRSVVSSLWRWVRSPAVLLGSALVMLNGCAQVYTTSPGAVGVNRSQYMSTMVSQQQLDQQAAAQYRQVIAQAKDRAMLDTNAAQSKRVKAITERLIRQVGVFRPDAASWDWEVHLIKSPEVNAWCMPGGKIAVYTGMLDKIKPTDAELAAVIGHEIAHALREHARERVSQQMLSGLGISILSAMGGSQAATDLGSTLSNVMFTLPNSRQHEIEADRMGVELAARAGYDPSAAISLWQKMASQGNAAVPEMLSTHPSSQSRIQELQRAAEQVTPLYKK